MSSLSRRTALAVLAAAAMAVSSCGGGHGSSSNTPTTCSNTPGLSASFGNPTGANVVPLTIDSGPSVNGTPVGTLNQAYVTIKICVPGTQTCQTLDHVWIDTGSTGLRIVSSALTVSLPASPASTLPIGNCGQFLSSYTWGAVRSADILIGGETASAVPVQVIGDSSVPGTAPTPCSNGTTAMATVSDLGANALLGIGLFLQDCGATCASQATPVYWNCPSTTSACTEATMAQNQQLGNIVGTFTTDNTGTLIQIPQIPAQGQATAGGWLIFGINTQSNNQLGSALVFQADPGGTQAGDINTTTTYGSTSNPSSFVDSGSNGWFFNDPTLTACPTPNNSWFCSTAPLAATLSTCVGVDCAGFPTVSNQYNFCVASLNSLSGTFAAFNDIGGPGTAGSFDWGLPFFYGRSVFTALEGTIINNTAGPFFAASTP